MDELAAFADSYARSRRAAEDSLEARAGGRFERPEPRARGGLFGDGAPEGYPAEGYSPERYFGPRSRGREPPAEAERAWTPEEAALPRLVSLPARGGSPEPPARRGGPCHAWSPPAARRARGPRGSDGGDSAEDTLPPYSELELELELEPSRAPSHRGRDPAAHGPSSEKRRRREPAKKPVRPAAGTACPPGWPRGAE